MVQSLLMERTLILIKPDAMQRGLAGEIIARLERRGLRIVALRLLQVDEALASQLYAIHKGKDFYPGLIRYITSCPVLAAVLEGPGAIEVALQAVGATDPKRAAPGTIRGDLGVDIGRNLIHRSDSAETARYEIGLFFKEEDILSYQRAIDPWVFEAEG